MNFVQLIVLRLAIEGKKRRREPTNPHSLEQPAQAAVSAIVPALKKHLHDAAPWVRTR